MLHICVLQLESTVIVMGSLYLLVIATEDGIALVAHLVPCLLNMTTHLYHLLLTCLVQHTLQTSLEDLVLRVCYEIV